METFRVPLIDPDTREGFSVEVEAESPGEAISKADGPEDKVYWIATPFVEEHFDADLSVG